MEDVFIPEEYVIKRRMERRAAAALEAGKLWSSRRSQNEAIQAGNNQPKTTNTSILWLDHRADSFLHSCCF